jgi:hypothetical protein
MATNADLNVLNLDFDANQASLKNFLRSQTQFLDYNFEGSAMAVLLDVLSYNTHYMAFYLNMLASEMFIDSAVLRSSVVSLAKHLDYTPQSVRAAQAIVSIVVTPTDGATTLVIQKGTRFGSSTAGSTLNFITNQTYVVNLQNGAFTFPAVTLVEGIPYTFRYVVDSFLLNQRFLLPSAMVDTSTLIVQVQNSLTDQTLTTFTLADNFLQITATTNAFFLQESENGAFEVLFGDGVVGAKPSDGNLISLSYIITHGPDGNGAKFFVPSQQLSDRYTLANTRVSTIVPAAGGAISESIDSIRFNAPKNFETQGRAVTANDYELLVKNLYTNCDSVVVWGGETMSPPQWGKVFVSIKPIDGFVITDSAKQLVLTNIINQRNMVSIIPQFVDPDYTYIIVTSVVKYIPSSTTKTMGSIQALAYNAILSFSVSDLDKFFSGFKYSKLVAAIDACDQSVSNNITSIQMKKVFSPLLNVVQTTTFFMNSMIAPGTITSSSFVSATDPLMNFPYSTGSTYAIEDDGAGNLLMTQSAIGIPKRVVRNCGTVDYTSGTVTITAIIPSSADVNGKISITMTPATNDISPLMNNLLFINPSDVLVTALAVN